MSEFSELYLEQKHTIYVYEIILLTQGKKAAIITCNLKNINVISFVLIFVCLNIKSKLNRDHIDNIFKF